MIQNGTSTSCSPALAQNLQTSRVSPQIYDQAPFFFTVRSSPGSGLLRLADKHLSLAIFDDKELMAMVALLDDHLSISPNERWGFRKTIEDIGMSSTTLVGFILNVTLLSQSNTHRDILSDMYADTLSDSLSNTIWHLFWHSLWHSMWHLALAIEFRQCPLSSGARGWGGWGGKGGGGGRHAALIKSRDSHLAGGKPIMLRDVMEILW